MKRTKTGIITSAKMQWTVTIEVREYIKHHKYAKNIPVSQKFHAHTDVPLREGYVVTIEETAPRSKTVCWRVIPESVQKWAEIDAKDFFEPTVIDEQSVEN